MATGSAHASHVTKPGNRIASGPIVAPWHCLRRFAYADRAKRDWRKRPILQLSWPKDRPPFAAPGIRRSGRVAMVSIRPRRREFTTAPAPYRARLAAPRYCRGRVRGWAFCSDGLGAHLRRFGWAWQRCTAVWAARKGAPDIAVLVKHPRARRDVMQRPPGTERLRTAGGCAGLSPRSRAPTRAPGPDLPLARAARASL
jgi:hypothetical protein